MTNLKPRSIKLAFRLLFLILIQLMPACAVTEKASATATENESSLSRPKVVWAGLSVSGPSKQIPNLFRFSIGEHKRLDRELYEKARSLVPQHYSLNTEGMGEIRKGETLGVTLAMDYENVAVRKIAGMYQAVVEVNANLIVYDFDGTDSSIIAIYPIGLGQYIETYEGAPPSDAEMARLVSAYIFGGLSNMPDSLVSNTIETLKSMPIKFRYGTRIGIGKIDLSDDVAAELSVPFNASKKAMKDYFARLTARVLSNENQISVLPRFADQSIAKMAINFTGKETTLLLKIPEPDYLLNVTIEKLANQLKTQNKHEKLYLYAARARFQMQDAFDGEVINVSVRDFVNKIMVSDQTENNWAIYQGAIDTTITEFVRQFDSVDDDWMALQDFNNTNDEPKIRKQFSQLSDLMEQCR